MNLRNVVMGLGLMALFGTGCVVEVVRGPYEGCKSGDSCSNGTVCTSATYTSNGGPATFCSIGCTRGEQCPVSPYGSGYLPTCVVSVSAGSGLCYDTCVSNFDCGTGTVCATIPGTSARVCVPSSTAGTTCGGSGQVCCASNACAAGLACNGGVCSAPVVTCGASGQACCAGNTCGTGLVCNAGVCGAKVTPTRTAYQKCVQGTDVCGGGTVCQSSIAVSAGKSQGAFCTTGCPSGLDSACPGYVPGAAAQAVTCLNLTGTVAQAQCFRRCQTQNDCADYNTTCTMFSTTTGGSIRVCVPVGPRA